MGLSSCATNLGETFMPNPPDNPSPPKPEGAGVLALLIFLGLWLLIQLGFNSLINRLGVTGLEQFSLRIFQFVAGVVTLAPIAGYYLIDRRAAALSNPAVQQLLNNSTPVNNLKRYSQRLLILSLLVLTFFIC